MLRECFILFFFLLALFPAEIVFGRQRNMIPQKIGNRGALDGILFEVFFSMFLIIFRVTIRERNIQNYRTRSERLEMFTRR